MVLNDSLLGSNVNRLPSTRTVLKRALQAELVLGVASRRCRGNGICRMFTPGKLQISKKYCHYSLAEIECDKAENLIFKLQTASMRPSTQNKFFANDQFLMEESFQIPEFMSVQLKLSRNEIKQGLYMSYEFDK